MEVAWTTILIIALLLPGLFFFIGYSTGERYRREIVKSNAIGEIGWAVFIAICVHLCAWGVLAFLGFDLAASVEQIADYDAMPRGLLVDGIVRRILPVSIYVLGTGFAGLVLGWLVSLAAHRGHIPYLVTHKWINQVKRSMREGLVTASVMTNTVQNNRVLMYKGILAEFYQNTDGKFAYVVLKNCSRYFMNFDEASPRTGEHTGLIADSKVGTPDRTWDFLQIEGDNIANVLFDPSPQLLGMDKGRAALEEAIQNVIDQIQRTQSLNK